MDGITDSMDMSLSKLQEMVKDKGSLVGCSPWGSLSLQGAFMRRVRYRVRDAVWNFSTWLGAWPILSSWDEVKGDS